MGGTLLLADDSITIQKVVELTFAETEHKVIAVGSGRELFKRLPEVKPDVVLCDVVMPDMNGYDVCQTLKSDPATLHIPVVLLTGTFEPFDRDRAMAAGCDGIVTKPFEARELITTVEELIKRARSTAAAPPPGEVGALDDQGIPEGVPTLDFTTTGFDKMGVQPPPPPPAHDDGMDLTASALGNSHPTAPRPTPPELQEPAVKEASQGFALVEERPPAFAEMPAPSAAPAPAAPPAPEPPVLLPATAEPFGTMIITPRPLPPPEPSIEPAVVFTPADRAMEEAPTQRFVVQTPEEPAPPVVAPAVPTPAPAEASPAPSPGAVEAPSREATQRMPRPAVEPVAQPQAAPSAPAPEQPQLTDEQVERIARRVVELAGPQLERIAWEVLPDMAEIVVRKRIHELETAAEEEK